MSMGVPSPRERERITQVLPGQGWRRCEVAILETRGEVRSELSTVIGFALFQWDEILQGELKSLFELRPLIREFSGGLEVVDCASVPFPPANGTGFLVDPLWNDARLQQVIGQAAEEVRKKLAEEEAAEAGGKGSRRITRRGTVTHDIDQLCNHRRSNDPKTESFPATQSRWLMEACTAMGLEGVIMKRKGSLYRPGYRSPDWIKVPIRHTEEFM